ncbi:tRNA pseudouridine(38/39) synthase-like [Anopheles albimanus]|uniref:tRNA pseudouridine(38/39) synthase-like n=1 Tax=Anopheles albimanus TaxID=7167 RepID=UPI001641C7CC|nr:tRNA pseudouridine(38/39) synthase-like [Anopheles albimanus]
MDVRVNRKSKSSTDEELMQLSKQELIDKIKQLEAHNTQLKCIVQKNLKPEAKKENGKSSNKRRAFDFSKCHKRHILLRFFYLGWGYQGFAAQEDSIETIEHHLFTALQKVCLIESRETSNYNRCGRTDKGVSAFHQVISIDVRSKIAPEDDPLSEDSLAAELDYCGMLNRVLPEEIRCLAWMPMVNPGYSARFDCRSRTYRYFFPRGNLRIDAMQEACGHLVGVHDFRNLCKMDVGNGVVNFVRSIDECTIHPSQTDSNGVPGYDMMYLQLRGKAFLWHQVRCIMAVLLLVGDGKEDPAIVKQLLDVDSNPCKPQYSMASDVPLNLYDCQFNDSGSDAVGLSDVRGSDLRDWIYKEEDLRRTISDLQSLWAKASVKTTMIREMLVTLQDVFAQHFGAHDRISNQASSLTLGVRSREYCPLLQRQRCESLENRIEHFAKKRRIEVSSKSIDSGVCPPGSPEHASRSEHKD